MNKLKWSLFLLSLIAVVQGRAQNNILTEKQFIKSQINVLASKSMHGRGYVENGRDDAAKYIQKKFKELNLRAFAKAPAYLQGYDFPVNTFPGNMYLSLNKKELTPGEDYIIDPSSPSFTGDKLKVEYIDLATLIKFEKKKVPQTSISDTAAAITDSSLATTDSTPVKIEALAVKTDTTALTTDTSVNMNAAIPPVKIIKKIDKEATDSAWYATLSSFNTDHVYYLDHLDSFCSVMHFKPKKFPAKLRKGCYIIPEKDKLTWDISGDTTLATVFYVKETSLPDKIKTATVDVKSLFIPKAHSDNLIGCVPGAVKDSFIAFTAHYDHLGMMGDTTVFPGASDNASGTAMLLYLASYFSAHPQHYSILFIAFSGEEPGLLGSAYYVTHPIVPLKNIKFLTNIDIMGDAADGITVVNATEFPTQFSELQKINDSHNYIPVIKSRGKASNSDHYFFTEKGVPSFFMYSNGGKGFYHDIYDNAHEITLNNIEGVASLIIDFTTQLK